MRIGICGPVNPHEFREFFPQDVPSLNNGATAVNTLIKELLREGHEVIVFTSEIPSNIKKDYVLKGAQIDIHVIHSNPGLFLTHALSRLYMIPRLERYISKYIKQVDVIHAQWTYDFALAAKHFEKQKPIFCTVRDWCPYIMSLQKGARKIQWILYYFIFKRVMNSDKIHFIANSDYTYTKITHSYPQKKIDIINNPIDKKYILRKKQLSVQNIVFISIASCLTEKRKNIPILLEAFHIFREKKKDCILKLVGGGLEEHTSEYKSFFAQGLLDGVILLGQLSHPNLIKEIDSSSCLIHPSLEETFGNILIEGMARCVPVIGGMYSGAVPQVLGFGKYGILCDVTNVESIVEAMAKSCDSTIITSIVSKATDWIIEKYSSDTIAKKHIELYNKITNN